MYRLSSLIKDITPEVVVKENEVTGMKSFSLLEDEILEDQESNRIFRPRIKPRYILFNLVFFFVEDFCYERSAPI